MMSKCADLVEPRFRSMWSYSKTLAAASLRCEALVLTFEFLDPGIGAALVLRSRMDAFGAVKARLVRIPTLFECGLFVNPSPIFSG